MGIERVSILDYGAAGTGKTTAITTLLKQEQLKKTPDLQIRFLCTESNSLRGIKAGLKLHGISLKEGQLIYMVAKPSKTSTFKQRATDYENYFLNKTTKEAANIESSKKGREPYKVFYQILMGMGEYMGTDLLTGETKNYGDVGDWTSNIVFVVDSLTSVVQAQVIELMGERQIALINDYNNVGNAVLNKVIIPLTEQAECSLIMLGHTDVVEDQDVVQPSKAQREAGMTPILKIAPKTYGNKTSWSLPAKFTETIYSYIKDDKFFWASKGQKQITSVRSFPRSETLVKDYSLYDVFLPE